MEGERERGRKGDREGGRGERERDGERPFSLSQFSSFPLSGDEHEDKRLCYAEPAASGWDVYPSGCGA